MSDIITGQVVEIRLLKPDAQGVRRVCIHYLARDPEGPVRMENQMLNTSMGISVSSQELYREPVKGWRLACQPDRKSVAPQLIGNKSIPVMHTDDPRAVTCPLCQQTESYKKHLSEIQEQEAAVLAK